MKDRRAFLKEVCPTVAFAFFGVSFLEACSADSLEEDTGDGTSTANGGSSDNGYTKNGSTYTIDLTHSNFSSKLSKVGDWMNVGNFGIDILLLRTASNHIQAYTNECPYHNQRYQWELVNSSTFRCTHKNNTFSTDCDNSSALDCYESSLSGNELEVTIS